MNGPTHDLVTQLGLEAHPEGGWFRQTHETVETVSTPNGVRPLMNSIYYLLTPQSPIGALHRNRSDIIHFHHLGGPVQYLLVHPDGEVTETTLGPDHRAGHLPSFTAPAGCWKTSNVLASGAAACLISEAVAPGFRYEDQEMATLDGFRREHPRLLDRFRPFIAEPSTP